MITDKMSNEELKQPSCLGSVICCGSFEKYAKQFSWMTFEDDEGNTKYLLPHINVICVNYDTIKMRVNNCPTCGIEVRGVEFSQEQFDNCR